MDVGLDGWETDEELFTDKATANFMHEFGCRKPKATEMAWLEKVLVATEKNLHAIKLANADLEQAGADARHAAASQQRKQFAALRAAEKVSNGPMPLTHSFV